MNAQFAEIRSAGPKLIEVESHHEATGGSNRGFGLTFAAVALLIAVWPMLNGGAVRVWALVLAVAFAAVALLIPSVLDMPNRLWTKFGIFLGSVVAPVVMVVVFFIAVAPIGLAMRLLGRDPLNLRLQPEAQSYWIERTDPIGPLQRQF